MARRSGNSSGAKIYAIAVTLLLVLLASGFFGWLQQIWTRSVHSASQAIEYTIDQTAQAVSNHFDNADAKAQLRSTRLKLAGYKLDRAIEASNRQQLDNVLRFSQASFQMETTKVALSKIVMRLSRSGREIMWTTLPAGWDQLDQIQPAAPLTTATLSAATDLGLVGRIIDFEGRFGQILPLHSVDSRISVDVGAGVQAIAQGTGKANELSLLLVPKGSRIRLGDLAISNGKDGLFPPGLAVGKVTTIETPADGMYDLITVEMTQQFHAASLVWLLHHKL